MKRQLRSIIISVVAAILSMGIQCDGPVTLPCNSPHYSLAAGSSIELLNPCATDPEGTINGQWRQSDHFFFVRNQPPGVSIDTTRDQFNIPVRRLVVDASVPPGTTQIDFEYNFVVLFATGDSATERGIGQLVLTVSTGALTASATANPMTVTAGDRSFLNVDVTGGTPPYSFEWTPADSLNHPHDPDPVAHPSVTTQYHVTVTDANGNTADAAVTVTVGSSLTITTASLLHGAIGQRYDQVLNSNPASAADTWTVVNGAVPPGINLQTASDGSGVLSGFPQSSGIFAFTVQVQDANGQTATKDLSITIDNPKPVLTSLTPQSAPVGAPDMQLTIAGESFVDGAIVTFGAGTFTPSCITPTQILVTIPAGSLSQAGSPGVFVTNPDPGGVRSDETLFFQIEAPPPPPGILIDVAPPDSSQSSLAAAIGADGRFAAFWSPVTNLVSPATTLPTNLFLGDTCLGASCNPSTTLISAVDGASPPSEANFSAAQQLPVAMSDDANIVGLVSSFTNLVSPPTVQVDNAFVRYTCANVSSSCTPRTVLASVTNAGVEPNSFSTLGDVSADGRYVAFVSWATNILSSPVTPSPGGELYLRDTCVAGADSSLVPGCTPQSTRLSLGTQQTVSVREVALSSFGRFVAFVSNAQGPIVTSSSQVFLSDTRGSAGPTLTLLSHDNLGNPASASGHSSNPSISADGRFVVFTSDASNLPGGGDASLRIYRADTSNPGAPLVLLGTPASSTTSVRSISADGRFVLFFSSGFSLSVLDTCETTTGPVAGCQTKTNLISVDSQGQPVAVIVSVTSAVGGFAISRDGHYALFMYEDANFVLHVALAATGF